jgi:hypothetical protein
MAEPSKRLDAVEMVREIRDTLSETFKGPSIEEEKRREQYIVGRREKCAPGHPSKRSMAWHISWRQSAS